MVLENWGKSVLCFPFSWQQQLLSLLKCIDELSKFVIEKCPEKPKIVCQERSTRSIFVQSFRVGSDVALADKQGRQLAHLAAIRNHCNILKFLHAEDICLDVTCNQKKLPTHYAAQHGGKYWRSRKVTSEQALTQLHFEAFFRLCIIRFCFCPFQQPWKVWPVW